MGLPDRESGVLPEQNGGTSPAGEETLGRGPQCSGAGQLRTVVALYLVAQAAPDGSWLLGGDDRVEIGQMQFGAPERAAAAQLLDVPPQQVTAWLSDNWAAVRSPVAARALPFGIADLPGSTGGGEAACP
jgi:hypothetical protein